MDQKKGAHGPNIAVSIHGTQKKKNFLGGGGGGVVPKETGRIGHTKVLLEGSGRNRKRGTLLELLKESFPGSSTGYPTSITGMFTLETRDVPGQRRGDGEKNYAPGIQPVGWQQQLLVIGFFAGTT